MKLCPNCGANVEGLIHHCDCCLTLLNPPEKKLWYANTFEVAFDFHTYVHSVVNKMETIKDIVYWEYFEAIYLDMYCYPTGMVQYLKLKHFVRCSLLQKRVDMRILVDYDAFVQSDKDAKRRMVETAILDSHEVLEKRLEKAKIQGGGIEKIHELFYGSMNIGGGSVSTIRN